MNKDNNENKNISLKELKEKYGYDNATPVMKQYLDIKFDNINSLILFRMGDFYELFYEDAIKASKILAIALTKRSNKLQNHIPMCGVPHHTLENYIAKLLEKNYKIAICEQTETPEEAKKRGGYKAVVERKVTKIITPGTLLEDSIIDSRSFNYLASIVIDNKKNIASIAYANLSTTEFSVTTLPFNQIENELTKISPREILLNSDYQKIYDNFSLMENNDNYTGGIYNNETKQQNNAQLNEVEENRNIIDIINNSIPLAFITYQESGIFNMNRAKRNIMKYFSLETLESISSSLKKNLYPTEIQAINSIIEYISITQKIDKQILQKPKIIQYNDFMLIDNNTHNSLEIIESQNKIKSDSLYNIINKTITNGGSRELGNMLLYPLKSKKEIEERLEITEFFLKNFEICENNRKELENIYDIERYIAKIKTSTISPKELISLKTSLEHAENIKDIFTNFIEKNSSTNITSAISSIYEKMIVNTEISNEIDRAIDPNCPNNLNDIGVIKENYDKTLESLSIETREYFSRINELKEEYKKITNIENIKINSNNIIGLFIEIPSRYANTISNDIFKRKQTMGNSVRYKTVELEEAENNMIKNRITRLNLEKDLFSNLCHFIQRKENQLITLANIIKTIDVFCNFAYIAKEYNLAKPLITEDISMDIVDGRHMIVEEALKNKKQNFVSNNTHLTNEEFIWLITGPNMAGKSTFLRQNAHIVILSHIGCFIPAKYGKIGIVDKIFSRLGSQDNLASNQSTFMVEMVETAAMLNQATNKSLLILDEVGRGTSTYDGIAIAYSTLKYIHDNINSRCLFATHYHELTSIEKERKISNYQILTKSDKLGKDISFLYKIQKGIASKSYGIFVAKIAGMPNNVIKESEEILASLTKANKAITINSQDKQILSDNKYNEILEYIKKLSPEDISSRQALDKIYEIKEIYKKIINKI
ncbi:MAG TPA: DNA mismatch repair protein MutS [Candidatus Megaira endosymbiont of Hartmannula sinica]|nr:DNA mismatch repair protein MutS [Candidatus Megaera endosymbiont of Hartmannula sinica]